MPTVPAADLKCKRRILNWGALTVQPHISLDHLKMETWRDFTPSLHWTFQHCSTWLTSLAQTLIATSLTQCPVHNALHCNTELIWLMLQITCVTKSLLISLAMQLAANVNMPLLRSKCSWGWMNDAWNGSECWSWEEFQEEWYWHLIQLQGYKAFGFMMQPERLPLCITTDILLKAVIQLSPNICVARIGTGTSACCDRVWWLDSYATWWLRNQKSARSTCS